MLMSMIKFFKDNIIARARKNLQELVHTESE